FSPTPWCWSKTDAASRSAPDRLTPRFEDQRLRALAERAVAVRQRAARDPGTPIADPGLRAQQDPRRAGLAPEDDREIGVHERHFLEINDRGNPAAQIGGGDGVDQRRVRLTGDERALEMKPAGGRTRLEQAPLHDPRVDTGEERAPAAGDV